MKPLENLISEESEYFMFSAAPSAKEMFFYPLYLGDYDYEAGYRMFRNSYDSFLIMEIVKGSCEIDFCGQQFQAYAGQLVFLNCYLPHGYSTTTGWRAKWLHFDGPLAEKYYNEITKQSSFLLGSDSAAAFEKEFTHLFQAAKNGHFSKDAQLSLAITTILTKMLDSKPASLPEERNMEVIGEITAYINQNFNQTITLEQLANMAHLSPFYFTKLFKNKTGYSPHEYLISTRLNHSRYLLKKTALTIKEICFACGFASESRFCTSFKNDSGMTPSQYRNLTL